MSDKFWKLCRGKFFNSERSYFPKSHKSFNLYGFNLAVRDFVGAGTVNMFLSAQKDQVKAYKRELEKSSVAGADNASKVDVLEAKIKTLEKAFNTVIDERTQLEIQIKSLNSEIDNMRKKGS